MNPTPDQELLSRLFEGELSEAEAEALARRLNASSALKRDLRQHLMIWEVWSQHQAPERSAAAFFEAWKTRLRAENEGADRFREALRAQLEARDLQLQPPVRSQPRSPALSKRPQTMGAVPAWMRAAWAAIHRPMGIAGAISAVIIGLLGLWWLVIPWSAHAVTTIQGEAVCTACVLHESHEHAPAIRVISGGAPRIYYLERNPAVTSLQDRFCGGPTPVVAKGITRTKGGRLLFEATNVAVPDADKPREKPKDNERILFPI
jgi:hypothetical protein